MKARKPARYGEQLSLLAEDEAVRCKATVIRNRFTALQAALEIPAWSDVEDIERFDALFDALLIAVLPMDSIEFIYVRDAAILTYEIVRLRQAKLALVDAAQPAVLQKTIQQPFGGSDTKRIAAKWRVGDKEAVSTVEKLLRDRGLQPSAIFAQAIEIKLDQIQTIEAMIASMESRRFTFIREIERRRDQFKRRLEEAVRNADDSYSVAENATVANGESGHRSSDRSDAQVSRNNSA